VYSKEYLEAVGFDTERDRVYPDLAFSLPRHVIPVCGDFSGQRPVIGVGLKDYYGEHGLRRRGEDDYHKYLGKTADFVTWLLANNYSVRVLMGDAVYDGRVKEDLIELLEKRGVNCNDGRVLDEPVSSVEQLLTQLAATDVVVSPRFHNIILALMLNKPVISLSYHEKFSSLMADMGLPEYCQHLDHLDVGKLSAQLQKLERDTISLTSCVKRKTEEYRRALDEQYSLILNEICDRPLRHGLRLASRPSRSIGC
jgi:polysaccharide pyruvyl transferase WcaK-like protein